MIVFKKDEDVREVSLDEAGISSVTRKILIGPEDGSENIIMRLFKVAPGGHTPYHTHELEHIVKVLTGRGIIRRGAEEHSEIAAGQSVFIPKDAPHQFRNPFDSPLEFLCIILNPDRTRHG